MRSLLLRLVLVAALMPDRTSANAVPEQDSTTLIPSSSTITDTLADRPAPWEAKPDEAVVTPPALQKEKSNGALYGWGFAILAAAGMTLFIWRNSKSAS